MNLLFRLLKVLLRALARPGRMALEGESRLEFRVWPNDLDTNLHMNNGRYLTLMDLGRLDLLLRLGLGGAMFRRRWLPVLGAGAVRWRRSLGPFQSFTLRTRLVCWDAKWLYLEQRMESGGQLYCQAHFKGLFRRGRETVPTADLLALLGRAGAPSPPMPEGLRLWEEAQARLAGPAPR